MASVRLPTRGEVIFACVVGGATFAWTAFFYWGYLSGREFAVVLIASALQVFGLAWRRAAPFASVSLVFIPAVIHMWPSSQVVPTDFLIFVNIYVIASLGRKGAAWIITLLLGVTVFISNLIVGANGSPMTLGDAIILTAVMVSLAIAALSMGASTHARIQQVDAFRSRAEEAEKLSQNNADLATAAERNRIAREMHDIIAHSLSVIISQADGGRYAAANDPEAATRALQTIAEVGRDSLADMRKLLGVLRVGDDDASPTVPQPMSEDLDALVAQVREAGLKVSLVRIGEPRQLPPGAGLTVYRIVQEALTNAMKHAGPQAKVTVIIQWLRSALSLEISDDGRGAAAVSDGKGQGLIGMRERAAIFGGTVSAGPRTGGGFSVRILIPLPDPTMRGAHE